MRSVFSLVFVAVLLVGPFAIAKDKPPVLPTYLLQARTVAVIIDPDVGQSATDPQANRVAQKDVESALLNWGRFEPILTQSEADLIIVIRKGNGKVVNATVKDPRQNNRPVLVDPTDTGVAIGAQRGRQPGNSTEPAEPNQSPHPQTEVGPANDVFSVYQGRNDNPLDASPAWRYIARDGLRAHNVPAVDAFRKAIAQAEKAAGQKP